MPRQGDTFDKQQSSNELVPIGLPPVQAAGAHSPRDVVEPAAPVLGTAITSRGSAPLSSSTGSEVGVTPRSRWPRFPSIYEINTWVWLAELAGKTGTRIDLGAVPPDEWDRLAAMGFDAVWLMGVWERSPAGIAIANRNEGLLSDFRRALPDFRPEDNVGSPYCIRQYVVDPHLGGREGLARARAELARRGLRLLLDFVPNHVAPDHPWAMSIPSTSSRAAPEDAGTTGVAFVEHGAGLCLRTRSRTFRHGQMSCS